MHRGSVTLWLALGLAGVALACDGDTARAGGAEPAAAPAPVPAASSPTSVEGCGGGSASCAEGVTGDLPPGGVDAVDLPGAPDRELEASRAAVRSILQASCGSCHGQSVPRRDAPAGINYIDDIDELVEGGLIIPLSSGESRIVTLMRSGDMPPPGSEAPRVASDDIDRVAEFIDSPASWSWSEPEARCPSQSSSLDDVYAAIAADLDQLGAAAAFTRYISLADRVNAGVCLAGNDLDPERFALSKLVNMLSTADEVRPPEAIDANETIFRLDLRDYGWDQPVSVVDSGGSARDYADKWEAIVGHDPYAVPHVGGDADVASGLAGSDVPLLSARSMLHAAVVGNLYYALIGVDVRAPLSAFIAGELEVDTTQTLQQGAQVRAGTTRSRLRSAGRLIQRDELGSRDGVLWQVFDLADGAAASLAEAALQLPAGPSEAIFTLPNGAFGYLQADADGRLLERSAVAGEGSQTLSAVSCSLCHSRGLIPVADEARQSLLESAIEPGQDAVARLQALFPDAPAFAAIVAADNAAFFESALEQASVPVGWSDPVADVFLAFDRDLSLPDAAGDLGVTPGELAAALPALAPALAVLEGGALARPTFTALFRATACALPRTGSVRPSPAACAAPPP